MNAYSKLIEEVCEATIPGWKPPVRITVNGKFAPDPAEKALRIVPPTFTIKVKVGAV